MHISRLVALLLLMSMALGAWADFANIRLETQTGATVADGKSTVGVRAYVQDRDGKNVPDGTQIVFTTTMGSFDEPVVKTLNGVAHTTLRAGSIPGMATISASSPQFGANTTLQFEFVSDRSMLSTAKEYVEVVSPNRPLLYSMDRKTIEASGPGKEAFLRYKDIEIKADDFQLAVPLYQVKARKATLKFGGATREFAQLDFNLKTKHGVGITTYEADEKAIVSSGRLFAFKVVGKRSKFGPVEINGTEQTPIIGTIQKTLFDFEDLTDSATLIQSRKATAYPRKEVQFQRAEVYVGGVRIMKLPLFQVNLYGPTPVLTDQILNLQDNQIAVNYPYYLTLKPGETSLLRLRMGERSGRSSAGTRGASLDYELNWNKGDDWDGGMVVQGLGRADWGVGIHQYWRMDEKTDASFYFDVPSHRSLYGNFSASRRLDGFSVSLNGSNTRSLAGEQFNSQTYNLVAETDPTRIGKLPVRMFSGIVASHSANDQLGFSGTQSSIGLRSRFQADQINLGKLGTFNADFSIAKNAGHNVNAGLTMAGNAYFGINLFPGASALFGYQFTEDPFTSGLLGRHHVTLQLPLSFNRASFDLAASRGLDIDSLSYRADARINLFRNMRFGYQYTYERYLGQGFTDYNFVLGYTLGFREFGLTWSNRTKRIGIQLLGAGY